MIAPQKPNPLFFAFIVNTQAEAALHRGAVTRASQRGSAISAHFLDEHQALMKNPEISSHGQRQITQLFQAQYGPWSLFHPAPVMRTVHDARRIHARDGQIIKLRDEIRGLSLQIRNAARKAEDLTAQLTDAMEEGARLNPCYTPADRIFLDIMQNRSRPPNGRRYSPETLHWGWTVYQ
jgi:hypothetical protein